MLSDRGALLALIVSKAVVRAPVKLASGRRAGYYIDLRRITLAGVAAPLVGRVMLEAAAPLGRYGAVGGQTLGADPVATAMLHASAARGRGHLDAFVVRKDPQAAGWPRIDGPSVAGCRVLVVEDTSTTGESVLAAVATLRSWGAVVAGAAVLVDRGGGAAIRAAGLPYAAAYTAADLGLGGAGAG